MGSVVRMDVGVIISVAVVGRLAEEVVGYIAVVDPLTVDREEETVGVTVVGSVYVVVVGFGGVVFIIVVGSGLIVVVVGFTQPSSSPPSTQSSTPSHFLSGEIHSSSLHM